MFIIYTYSYLKILIIPFEIKNHYKQYLINLQYYISKQLPNCIIYNNNPVPK